MYTMYMHISSTESVLSSNNFNIRRMSLKKSIPSTHPLYLHTCCPYFFLSVQLSKRVMNIMTARFPVINKAVAHMIKQCSYNAANLT